MTLIKTSFWAGLSTFIKLAANFIIAKILAIYVGPIGFAIIGQFQNFVSIVLIFSGNVVQMGVVKYVAEFKNNQIEKEKILSTAFLICLVTAFFICLILLSLSHFFSLFLLKTVHYAWLMDIFGISLFLYVFNSLLTSTLNGEGQIKLMTFSNMTTSISGLILTYFLTRYFGLPGALLALILGQSIFFGITLFLSRKEPWFKWHYFNKPHAGYTVKLLKFAMMSLISVLMLSVVQITIREYIGTTLSWQDAGYWQAVTRISDSYLALISSTLSVYYLPKLSSLTSVCQIKSELKKAFFTVFPIATLMALLVYLFRKKIILILFSSAFMPMEPLFFFQLLGDVLKIGSWLVVYNMLSKAILTRLFIFSETGFGIGYCALSMIFLKFYGLQGVTMAFCLSYLLYFIFMSFICYKKLRT